MKRPSVPILYVCLWFVYQSICLQQSLQAHFRTLSFSRLPKFGILSRLDSSCNFKVIGYYSTGTGSGNATLTIRMAYQLQEIGPDSDSSTGTPRLCLEYQKNHDSLSTNEEVTGSSQVYQANIGSSTETDSPSYTQCYRENSSNNFRYISGRLIHSSFTIPQEPDCPSRQGLGSSSGGTTTPSSEMAALFYPQPHQKQCMWMPATPVGDAVGGIIKHMAIGPKRKLNSPSTGENSRQRIWHYRLFQLSRIRQYWYAPTTRPVCLTSTNKVGLVLFPSCRSQLKYGHGAWRTTLCYKPNAFRAITTK